MGFTPTTSVQKKKVALRAEKMFFSSVLLLVLVAVYPTLAQVHTHALTVRDGREFFCSTHRSNSRHDADSKCRSRGMLLAIVENSDLMHNIWNHCRFCTNCNTGFWVDGVKESHSNYYVWRNGLVFNANSHMWYPGNPTNPNGLKCLNIAFWFGKLGLDDLPCSVDPNHHENPRFFVCERKAEQDA